MYRLLGRLDSDDLAEVLLGSRDQTRVVVKLYHRETTELSHGRALEETAAALAKLSHRGLERVVDVGLFSGRLAVVREDEGPSTLGVALRRLGTSEVLLTPALALTLVLEVLDALGRAHSAEVVHGGLCPSSIALKEDGRPVIADFGALSFPVGSLARRLALADERRKGYLAPECSGRTPVMSVFADIYAVGSILYELLTLERPSRGSGRGLVRHEPLTPPSRLVPGLRPRLDTVILRALEPVPGRRHKSCADFADDLRRCLSETGGVAPERELGLFARRLFPNEVLKAVAEVPFAEAFELEPITPAADGVPVAREPGDWSEAARRRMRTKEDFSSAEGPPRAEELVPVRPPGPGPRERTVLNFVRPFLGKLRPRATDPEVRLARARRQARWWAFLGALVLTGTVLGMLAFWLLPARHPREAFREALPGPLRGLLPASPECYRGPAGTSAGVEVVSRGRVRLEVDGQEVCDGSTRVGVRPGRHSIRVVDVSSQRVYVTSVIVELGRQVKIVPDFKP